MAEASPARVPTSIQIELGWPAKQLSPNARCHHMEKWRYAKASKDTAFWTAKTAIPAGYVHDGSRVSLGLTAYPPDKQRRDDDNLIASFKNFRDGIALALKCDDSLFDQKPIQWGEPERNGRIVVTLEMFA